MTKKGAPLLHAIKGLLYNSQTGDKAISALEGKRVLPSKAVHLPFAGQFGLGGEMMVTIDWTLVVATLVSMLVVKWLPKALKVVNQVLKRLDDRIARGEPIWSDNPKIKIASVINSLRARWRTEKTRFLISIAMKSLDFIIAVLESLDPKTLEKILKKNEKDNK